MCDRSRRSAATRMLARVMGILGLALLASLSAWANPGEENQPRPWNIYLSGFGGRFTGALFPQNFTVDSNRTAWLYVDAAESDDVNAGWSKAASQSFFGATLGFSYDLAKLFEGSPSAWGKNLRILVYLEGTYVPTLRFPDGLEREAQHYWDAGLGRYVNQVVERSQTDRKAQTFGFALGLVFIPFKKIPIGLDCKFGLWKFRQEYISGTCSAYGRDLDVRYLEDTTGRGLGSYEGDGRWVSRHWATAITIGLRFYPLRWICLDLTMADLMYFQNEATGLYYVDTGASAYSPEPYDLGSMLTAGLTVYF
ncbi:MAG: hypothetical protein FJY83_10960 [Candidatus Aminicenantes bacterium]|nr:hypothetical protein [Candidatus Aminicenantes bacterium]